MLAVIFEVEMNPGRGEDYFELAGELRSALESVDGFISVERFQSLNNTNKYVSVSFWRDEKAVRVWREHAGHRVAQERGKRRDWPWRQVKQKRPSMRREMKMAKLLPFCCNGALRGA